MIALNPEDKKLPKCKFDGNVKCFVLKPCEEDSLLNCLKANLYLAQKELLEMKEDKMKKHNAISIKWRDQAFYYKKRVRLLSAWIKAQGLQVPILQELYQLFPVEVKDAGIPNNSKEGSTK